MGPNSPGIISPGKAKMGFMPSFCFARGPMGVISRSGSLSYESSKRLTLAGIGQTTVIGIGGEPFDRFVRRFEALIRTAQPGTMLYPAICQSYEAAVQRLSDVDGVSTIRTSVAAAGLQARPSVFQTSAGTFLRHREVGDEVFGPSTVIVRCAARAEMEAVARHLEGQLTATIHGAPSDLAESGWLMSILEGKAGRLLVNGFPTGVEVCASMQHGGPYPATTDARSTSVGTAAIGRFVRPVAYQNFPQPSLPAELQDANPRAIWRLLDGALTKDAIA